LNIQNIVKFTLFFSLLVLLLVEPQSVSLFWFTFISLIAIVIKQGKRGDHLFLFLLGVVFVFIVYHYWQNFYGNPYYLGRMSDDWQYDQLWSEGYAESYGLNPFHLSEYLGILHNSKGYVYLIVVLRKLSEIVGEYHTILPRIINIAFLLLTAEYSSRILYYYIKDQKYQKYCLYSVFLYPETLFNSAHVFRDTLIGFIFVLLFYLLLTSPKKTSSNIIIVISLLVLTQLRMEAFIVAFVISALLKANREKQSVIVLSVIGLVAIVASLFIFQKQWVELISGVNRYSILNIERRGELGSAVYKLPIHLSIIPKLLYPLITPTPSLSNIHQAFVSFGTWIKIGFIPFLFIGLVDKRIDIKIKVVFLSVFVAISMSSGTFRHISMYIPFGIILAILGVYYHGFKLSKSYFWFLSIFIAAVVYTFILILL